MKIAMVIWTLFKILACFVMAGYGFWEASGIEERGDRYLYLSAAMTWLVLAGVEAESGKRDEVSQ